MKRKWCRVLVMVTGLSLAAQLSAQSIDFSKLLKQAFPEADRFSQLAEPVSFKARSLTNSIFPAYKGDTQVGVAFYASPKGYGGKIHLLSSLDMNGVVKKVAVFSHNETPSYVPGLYDGSYLRQFNGIGLGDRMSFLIGAKAQARGDIQVMTGATETSKPIALAVSEARKLFVEIYRP